MDQVSNTDMTVVVPLVGGTSTFAIAFWYLWRRQATPCRWPSPAAFRLDFHNKAIAMPAEEKQVDEDEIVYDCLVCLCQVSSVAGDEHRRLPNCEHGLQFHAHCIDAWLEHNSTCPLCRSHIPRPLTQRLRTYLFQHLLQDIIISYCHSVLDNVATSIGDCRDF